MKNGRMRLRAYAPDGASLGLLPTPSDPKASFPLNDLGSLKFNYSPKGPRSSLLGQPCEIALEISPDGGSTWTEPRDARFMYTADGLDPIDASDRYDVDCKPYIWRLAKAIVLPSGLLNADGKRAFLISGGSNPGLIMKTLLNEAQARGWASGITHSSFSNTTDSSGAAWAKQLTIYYTPGLDYWTILRNLADQGFCDFHMQGRELKIYNPDAAAGMAVDRTVTNPQVTLRGGRDLVEAPFRRSWEGLANFAYFAGDKLEYTFTNPGASIPWGRQEIFLSNGSVNDAGTAATITQAELAQTDAERTEHTHGLDFAQAASFPLIDYHVGNYVWSVVKKGLPSKLRVRQLTLTANARGRVGGNVVLNDRFIESDLRQKRRVEGITNGASGSASAGTGSGTVGVAETLAPAQVTGLSSSSVEFMGLGGFTQAVASLDWNDVTTNSDGSAIFDLSHYEVMHRKSAEAVSRRRLATTTTLSGVDLSPYPVGESWTFSVRAVDQDGNKGAFGDVVLVMAVDTTAPQAPSTPTATAKLGQISIGWDGLPATGSWPADFSHVEVHVSTTTGFTPSAGTMIDHLYAEGVVPYNAFTYGIPQYVKLVAVDKSGLKSAASAQATATPTRLVGSDLDPSSVTYTQLAFKDPGNIIPDGSFETQAYRDYVDGLSSAAISFTQVSGDVFLGDWAAKVDGTVNPSTFRSLVLLPQDEQILQIAGGEKLWIRFAYKATTGADGIFRLITRCYDKTGTNIGDTTHTTATVKNDTWQEVNQQVTILANTTHVRLFFELNNAGTTGQYWVDAVEVRRTVGTSIIQDAAITNALIANATIQDAKIANIAAGKITSGSVSADLLVAGSIKTASSGARVEMTSAGIKLINAAGLTTVEISPATEYLRINSSGDATPTGTTHPFQIGLDSGLNMRFDNNEILAANNGVESELALNLDGSDVHLSGCMRTQKTGTDRAALRSDTADLTLHYCGDIPEVRVLNGGMSAYRQIRASGFPIGSSSEIKVERSEFDPFPIIKNARSERWQYRPGYAVDGVWHYGPMADDLPDDLRQGEGEDMTVDPASLGGVVWEAVRLLTERVEVLEHAKR